MATKFLEIVLVLVNMTVRPPVAALVTDGRLRPPVAILATAIVSDCSHMDGRCLNHRSRSCH